MTTVVQYRPLISAKFAQLLAAHPRIGDGVAPEDQAYPYAVLYSAGSPPAEGPVADPNADGRPVLQLTCVGETADQVDRLADRLRPVLASRVDMEGWELSETPSVVLSLPGRRDDSARPPLFYAADQVRFAITPTREDPIP